VTSERPLSDGMRWLGHVIIGGIIGFSLTLLAVGLLLLIIGVAVHLLTPNPPDSQARIPSRMTNWASAKAGCGEASWQDCGAGNPKRVLSWLPDNAVWAYDSDGELVYYEYEWTGNFGGGGTERFGAEPAVDGCHEAAWKRCGEP
jgi:hypothetical protein